jgi:hypothetical protein
VTYYLIYKYDRKEDQKVRTLPFSTEPEAVIAACAVIAEGTGWGFEIINHDMKPSRTTLRYEIAVNRAERPKKVRLGEVAIQPSRSAMPGREAT